MANADTRKVYLVEVGVLMTDKSSPDYDYYANAYNRKYGFFDENQFYLPGSMLDKAKEQVDGYVRLGIPNTYGIVSEVDMDVSITDEQLLDDTPVEDEDYNVENIVYSSMKDADGNIVVDFMKES